MIYETTNQAISKFYAVVEKIYAKKSYIDLLKKRDFSDAAG